MDFYHILSMVHAAAGTLLFALALISILLAVLIAVKPAEDPANTRLVLRANNISLAEIITAVIVAVTGLIAMLMGGWSLSQFWLWMSLMIVVFYCLALMFFTKPARLLVAEGGSAVKTGMQVLLQIAQFMLLVLAFAFMVLKPSF